MVDRRSNGVIVVNVIVAFTLCLLLYCFPLDFIIHVIQSTTYFCILHMCDKYMTLSVDTGHSLRWNMLGVN